MEKDTQNIIEVGRTAMVVFNDGFRMGVIIKGYIEPDKIKVEPTTSNLKGLGDMTLEMDEVFDMYEVD